MIKLLLLAVLVSLRGCLEWFQEGNPVFLTDENFTQVTSRPRSYKFVKLFTPWCHFCRVLKEVVKELKHQVEQRKDIEFYQINCHLQQNTCFQLQAFSFPMTVMYGADGQLKDRIVGAQPLQVMRDFLDRNTQPEFKEEEAKPNQQEASPQQNIAGESAKKEESQKPTEAQHQAATQQPIQPNAQERQSEKAEPVKQQTPADPPSQPQPTQEQKPEHAQPHPAPPQVPSQPHPQQTHHEQTAVPQSSQLQANKQSGLSNSQKPDTPPPARPKPSQHPLPQPSSNTQQRSLQNHRNISASNQTQQASKLYIIAYVGIGVVMGYFLHDVLHRDHTRSNDQHPI